MQYRDEREITWQETKRDNMTGNKERERERDTQTSNKESESKREARKREINRHATKINIYIYTRADNKERDKKDWQERAIA